MVLKGRNLSSRTFVNDETENEAGLTITLEQLYSKPTVFGGDVQLKINTTFIQQKTFVNANILERVKSSFEDVSEMVQKLSYFVERVIFSLQIIIVEVKNA
ncbi:hypothetical protein HHI36_008905 [Cryptolaemus montrouzieri]|uniref:Uncharacterized protein n=1 Tax=Cryptolaemus montrouzieri TaxID=559131 RepID=A0ABD2MUD1_9CUCU